MKISSTGQYSFRQPVSCSSLVIDVSSVRTGISLPRVCPPEDFRPGARRFEAVGGPHVAEFRNERVFVLLEVVISSFGTGPANAWFAAGL